MIPKTIHYCWFGRNPLPPLAVKCIASWRKFLPDYEIKEWNEDNFDVNIIPYTAQAYAARKYAFVSDYARFWILYRYGGIYFDTDVEVIKNMDDIIAQGPFMGCERDPDPQLATVPGVAPGLGLGAEPGQALYKEILDHYTTLHFLTWYGRRNTKTVVRYTTEILLAHGLQPTAGIQQCAGVQIYPKAYFCPIDYATKQLHITPHTVSIHHFAESWLSNRKKRKRRRAKARRQRIAAIMAWIRHIFHLG